MELEQEVTVDTFISPLMVSMFSKIKSWSIGNP